MSRKALGRGLSALFTQNSSMDQDLVEIGVEQIDPTEGQPRHLFKQDKLEELAASIRTNGLIQPVVVRRNGLDKFQIIAGERRWRAAQIAGLQRIPCVIREVDDGNLLELSLIENLQRENLNPIEEAKAYRRLLEKSHMTQEQIAGRIGKDRSSITNSLRLLKLPKEIQAMVEEEQLSMGHARALLALELADEQKSLAARIIAGGLSVRDAERLAKGGQTRGSAGAGDKAGTGESGSGTQADPNVIAAEAKLGKKLGAPVKIKFGRGGGTVEIRFKSMDDLSRLYDVIMASR
ncbi:MAG TPA: ParB/RepB/Spo0J family partition protein [Blastocatellia bacterium]